MVEIGRWTIENKPRGQASDRLGRHRRPSRAARARSGCNRTVGDAGVAPTGLWPIIEVFFEGPASAFSCQTQWQPMRAVPHKNAAGPHGAGRHFSFMLRE